MDAKSEVRVYKYRWVILSLFCFVTVVNFMQLMQFTIVADIAAKYYDVDTTVIDATGLVFFIVYILFFLPVSYLIERYNLRVTVTVSSFLTLGGTALKIFSSGRNLIYIVLIGQTFCALGQVYMLSVPTKLATTWFGPKEVSTACALAVFGTQLGTAIGAIIPPFVLQQNESNGDISHGLKMMQIGYATVSGAVFVMVLLFFRANPKLPPSQSQLMLLTQDEDRHFIEDCKKAMRIRDFIIILLVFGIFNGVWNCFGILVNTLYTNYFPNGQTDIGIITLVTILLGGCVGNVIFGYVLDKTHQFKRISFFLMFASFLTFILAAVTMIVQSRMSTFFTIPLFGFFAASMMVVSYEFALESTYPIPESVSCSILNAWMFFFGIVASFGTELLLDVIGYPYTFVILAVLMLSCSLGVFAISPRLRRHEANKVVVDSSHNVNTTEIRL